MSRIIAIIAAALLLASCAQDVNVDDTPPWERIENPPGVDYGQTWCWAKSDGTYAKMAGCVWVPVDLP